MIDKISANNNYLLFYKFNGKSEDGKQRFHLLKWREVEVGNLTGMGTLVQLPKEALNLKNKVGSFFLNKDGQVCAIWNEGSLIFGDRFAKLKTKEEPCWELMLELESRTNRYVVKGACRSGSSVIMLIDRQAQIFSTLDIMKKKACMRDFKLLGGSTLIVPYYDGDFVSVVTARRDKLKLIADNVPVFNDRANLSFVDGSNSRKRLLVKSNRNTNGKIAWIKLRHH